MTPFHRTRPCLLAASLLIVLTALGVLAWYLAFLRTRSDPLTGLLGSALELVWIVVLPLLAVGLLLVGALRSATATERDLARATAAGRIGTWTYDPTTELVYVGASELVLLGRDSRVNPGWYPAFTHFHPDDVERAKSTLAQCIENGAPDCRNVYRVKKADGRYISVEARGFIERDAAGKAVLVHGVHLDITGRFIDTVEEGGAFLPSLKEQALNSIREGVLVVDMTVGTQPVIYVNEGFLRLSGYDENEVLGRNCRFLQASDRNQPAVGLVRDAIAQERAVRVTLRNYRKNGTMFWNELSLTPIHGHDGILTHYAGVAHDVTEAVEGLNKMREAAYQDGLTGIRNRLGLERDLEGVLFERGAHLVAVVLLNVRGMGALNESYGMDTGDRLLSSIARRLRAEPDLNRLSARTGGNEFAYAFTAATITECEAEVDRLRALLAEPFNVAGGRTIIGFSMGWASSIHSHEPAVLLRNAEIALSDARRSAAGTVRRFEPAMAIATQQRARLVAGMRDAIARDELTFQYQPIVDLHSGRIVQVEALMRWNHATYGPQSPAIFIPLAEESGLIGGLGDWGIDRAAHFASELAERTVDPIPISVNVSGAQFSTTPVLQQLLDATQRYAISPNRLVVELTESVLADESKLIAQLAEIRAAGFNIAIDDFGTGYSSLSYLQNYPLHEIKVDKGFIRNIETDSYSVKIVEMCVELAREIGCSVVAEGVETEAQCDILRGIGCDFAQGYFFARPMEEHQLKALLDQWPHGPRRRPSPPAHGGAAR
ncbi:bifunctional diguanylate cyclase/phosphodiesterase [Amorphus coralli]|uniref:bifunctional diguanylate cyclase/phosphodiesterase n=1 Tax=Amorphus coralli TaxID=340680 RepID=UPI00037D00A3|nr:GGDEF domain-containing phosphodiesterase [Amorphus coralli]